MFGWYMNAIKYAVAAGRRNTQVNVIVCASRCKHVTDEQYARLVQEAWKGVSL